MGVTYYVDFTLGSNGTGSAFAPFNSDAAMRSSGAVGGDVFICKGTKNGSLDLGTLAGTSLAKPISLIGVTDLGTLDRSSRLQINASGQSAALLGSGNYLSFENFDFRNSTGQTDQSSGSYIHFDSCVFHKGTGSATAAANGYDRYYRGNEFWNYSGTALSNAGTYGSTIEDNKFFNCGYGISAAGYRNVTIRNNAFASITSNAVTIPDNGVLGSTYTIIHNSFGTIGGDAIVFGGNNNTDVWLERNVFGAVTGTAIKITAGSPSGTTIGAKNNRFWSVGTNLGTNVNDLGLNITLASNPFTNAASDLTPASGSPLIGAGFNGGSFGAMQVASGGSGGAPTIKGARPTMEITLGETHVFDFITETAAGAVSDADSTPTFQVFDNATDTPLLTPTVTKRTGQTGNYRVSIAFTSGNSFTVGNSYNLVALATIGGVAKKFPVAKVVVRTGNVDAANVTRVAGSSTAGTNLKNAFDGTGGVTISANLSGTVTSVTGSVGSVTGAVGSVTGSVGGSVASVTGNVGGNVVGSVASVTGAVGSVTGAVGSVTGNVGGNLSGNVLGSVSGSVGSVTGAVGSVTGSVGSVAGSVGGSVASVAGAVGSVAGGVGGDVAGKVLGGGGSTITGDGVRASSVTGSVGSVTGSVGSVLGSVASVTGAVGSVTSVSNIATAVRDIDNTTPAVGSLGAKVNSAASAGDPWATNLPGSYASGTAGNIVGNRLDATITSRHASGAAVASVTGAVGSVTGAVGSVTGVSNIAAAVRDVDNTSPTTGSLGAKVNSAASAGDPWATVLPGAYAANTAGNIIGNRLDAAITSRHASGAAVASVTGAVGSVTGSVGSVTGSVGSVAGNVGGNVVGSVASVSGNVAGSVASVTGNVGGSVASVTGAVGSVTGSVGSVLGSVGSVVAGVALSASGLNAPIVETGLNAIDTMKLILASVAGTLSGAGTTTLIFKNPAGSATRLTVTTDADGNRTVVVATP